MLVFLFRLMIAITVALLRLAFVVGRVIGQCVALLAVGAIRALRR